MTNEVRDHHVLLGEGSLRSRGYFLQNTLILVATNAELNQGIPLVLRQEVFVHRFDHPADGTLSEGGSLARAS